jgi:DNA-directed RNA polymerase specialized sigma24 family protein
MRARWEALLASLEQSVRSLEAERQFDEMKQRHPVLQTFEEPGALVEHLNGRSGDLDEKDAIYGALVRIVQARGRDAPLATSLVWLGLWPGLDAIYRRRVHLFPGHPEELVSDLGDCFTALVEELDFGCVQRVAANLVWSTEREVIVRRREKWNEDASRDGLPDESSLGATDPIEPEDPPPPSRFGLEGDLPDEEEIAAIRERLIPVLGGDTDLVIGAAIYGQNQRQLGERLGLSHEAARKRVQRALARLRKHLGSR